MSRAALVLSSSLCLALGIAWQEVPRAQAGEPDGRPAARSDLLAPPDVPAADPSGLPLLDVLPRARVDLARAEFDRDGRPSDAACREGDDDDSERALVLPYDAVGRRWSTTFETGASGVARLFLDWSPGPDGMLFEVVLDGVRLPPPRDGWRPSRRRLVSDLGPRWLGRGRHMLEFVAREDVHDAALVLHALELRPPE